MNNDINIKNVIISSAIVLPIILVLNWYLTIDMSAPAEFTKKVLNKIKVSQNIAPQRLFVNVWRSVKNEYADESLNHQDWNQWKLRYLKHIQTMEDAEMAINSMLSSLNDPYTKFLLTNAYSKQKIILESKVTGIGLIFDKIDGKVVVSSVLDDSPAKMANIMAGDIVVSINGTKADNPEFEKLIEKLENKNTKKITISIERNGTVFTKVLKKKDIYIKTMDYTITKDNIGVIKFSSIMGEKAISDFKEIIEKTNDTKGLIIDLRNNYGGILTNAIEMADYMSENKHLLDIKTRANVQFQVYSDDYSILKEKPIVILINKKTASAAEILAGILRNTNHAVLVGENSYGKNSIQQVIPFPNETGLVLTTHKYVFSNGEDINKIGLSPDIVVEQDKNSKEDTQLQAAFSILDNF